MPNYPVLYPAIDTPDVERALYFAQFSAETGQGLKLGLEFFNANGPQGITKIRAAYPDLSLFLDLKYHDIPNTVGSAVREVSKLDIDYVNIHATGGSEMMKRAVGGAQEGATKAGVRIPKVLGVTLLTSLDLEDMKDVGLNGTSAELVIRLAKLSQKNELAGVVCSAMEIEALRQELGPDFVLMVPGIRPAGSDIGDQKRVMTPADAMSAGATHLVVGRPITQSDNPLKAIEDILESLS